MVALVWGGGGGAGGGGHPVAGARVVLPVGGSRDGTRGDDVWVERGGGRAGDRVGGAGGVGDGGGGGRGRRGEGKGGEGVRNEIGL